MDARLRRIGREGPLRASLLDYIAGRDSFYMATASADGDPYVQHRGGRPGFLVALDAQTLAFADYSGNRQYLSVGNLADNPRVMLFLMDYPNRRRLKIWGRAEVVDDLARPELAPVLAASAGEPVERVFVVHINRWDLNCPKWITPRYTLSELERLAS